MCSHCCDAGVSAQDLELVDLGLNDRSMEALGAGCRRGAVAAGKSFSPRRKDSASLLTAMISSANALLATTRSI